VLPFCRRRATTTAQRNMQHGIVSDGRGDSGVAHIISFQARVAARTLDEPLGAHRCTSRVRVCVCACFAADGNEPLHRFEQQTCEAKL
jgi:hypothetical protein